MVAAYQWSRPPGRRAYARARNARARNPPVAPNHRGECARFDFQVYVHRGQGQTPNANRHTHRHAERPIETAEWCLKPGHCGTERVTCASQSIFTKRSSRRARCHQPDQPCSLASRRSSIRRQRLDRSLAFTDPEPGRLLQCGRSRSGMDRASLLTDAVQDGIGRNIVAHSEATGPESWRDRLWLLMTLAGVLLLICAALAA